MKLQQSYEGTGTWIFFFPTIYPHHSRVWTPWPASPPPLHPSSAWMNSKPTEEPCWPVSKALVVPFNTSRVKDATMSACRAMALALSTASQPREVIICVPLMSARPFVEGERSFLTLFVVTSVCASWFHIFCFHKRKVSLSGEWCRSMVSKVQGSNAYLSMHGWSEIISINLANGIAVKYPRH